MEFIPSHPESDKAIFLTVAKFFEKQPSAKNGKNNDLVL